MTVVWPRNYHEAARQWYGDLGGYGWCDLFCVAETAQGHQCSRKPGHGPHELYCKQHAAMCERYHADPR